MTNNTSFVNLLSTDLSTTVDLLNIIPVFSILFFGFFWAHSVIMLIKSLLTESETSSEETPFEDEITFAAPSGGYDSPSEEEMNFMDDMEKAHLYREYHTGGAPRQNKLFGRFSQEDLFLQETQDLIEIHERMEAEAKAVPQPFVGKAPTPMTPVVNTSSLEETFKLLKAVHTPAYRVGKLFAKPDLIDLVA